MKRLESLDILRGMAFYWLVLLFFHKKEIYLRA